VKITEALVTEHRIFSSVFDQIESALPKLTSLTEVNTMAAIVRSLLEPHAKTETSLAYLALDHVLAEKGQLDRLHEEHEEIDDHLKEVHSAATCDHARQLLRKAILASRNHFRHEELTVFPFLEKWVQPETLLELGGIWLKHSAVTQTGS
jgi:hypothetical protein